MVWIGRGLRGRIFSIEVIYVVVSIGAVRGGLQAKVSYTQDGQCVWKASGRLERDAPKNSSKGFCPGVPVIKRRLLESDFLALEVFLVPMAASTSLRFLVFGRVASSSSSVSECSTFLFLDLLFCFGFGDSLTLPGLKSESESGSVGTCKLTK